MENLVTCEECMFYRKGVCVNYMSFFYGEEMGEEETCSQAVQAEDSDDNRGVAKR